jgi:hypothetical protein
MTNTFIDSPAMCGYLSSNLLTFENINLTDTAKSAWRRAAAFTALVSTSPVLLPFDN